MENMKDYFTINEVCDILKVSRRTIDRWKNNNSFPFIRIGKGIRIPKLLFNEWIKNQQINSKVDSSNTNTEEVFNILKYYKNKLREQSSDSRFHIVFKDIFNYLSTTLSLEIKDNDIITVLHNLGIYKELDELTNEDNLKIKNIMEIIYGISTHELIMENCVVAIKNYSPKLYLWWVAAVSIEK